MTNLSLPPLAVEVTAVNFQAPGSNRDEAFALTGPIPFPSRSRAGATISSNEAPEGRKMGVESLSGTLAIGTPTNGHRLLLQTG